LITSEVTARSFMVNWTHAPGRAEKYRVVYYPTRGGKPEEVIKRQSFQGGNVYIGDYFSTNIVNNSTEIHF
jgi:hypothetical protein